jgi:hypothetical protein
MKLIKPTKKSMLIAGITLAIAAPVLAFTYDEEKGGDVVNDFDFYTSNQESSRAELRGPDRTSGTHSAGGTFKPQSGNGKTSILQVLNKIRYTDRAGGTGSQPVAQLAITAIGNNKYSFFIVQDSQPCGTKTITNGQEMNISVSYGSGGSPKFNIGGTTCQKNTGRTPGNPTSTHNNRPVSYNGGYYAKLGAYNTAKSTSAAHVQWYSFFGI